MANNFQGEAGQTVPEMTDQIVTDISERYIELYENITGEEFQRADIENIEKRIEENINQYLNTYFTKA